MTLSIQAPTAETELKPKLVVIGVGGAGGNAVNNMIDAGLEDIEFVIANTDAQAMRHSKAERKIQLGALLTKGLGAGGNPQVGESAARESAEEIRDQIQGANMVFIAAGMGGGTGTGAAHVVAEIAKEEGVLTVGVVTKPFVFEGSKRARAAEIGIESLQRVIDTLIIIPNHNLFRVASNNTTLSEAFRMADEVLLTGVRGITDLMIMPGLMNLDFADVRTVMQEMGRAMMGTSEAEGDQRALHAAEAAISNPLLEDNSLEGAKSVLVSISGGPDFGLMELNEAAECVRSAVNDDQANIIIGSSMDEALAGKVRVTVIATGIDAERTETSHIAQKQSETLEQLDPPLETADQDNIDSKFDAKLDSKDALSKGHAVESTASIGNHTIGNHTMGGYNSQAFQRSESLLGGDAPTNVTSFEDEIKGSAFGDDQQHDSSNADMTTEPKTITPETTEPKTMTPRQMVTDSNASDLFVDGAKDAALLDVGDGAFGDERQEHDQRSSMNAASNMRLRPPAPHDAFIAPEPVMPDRKSGKRSWVSGLAGHLGIGGDVAKSAADESANHAPLDHSASSQDPFLNQLSGKAERGASSAQQHPMQNQAHQANALPATSQFENQEMQHDQDDHDDGVDEEFLSIPSFLKRQVS
ncbi:MAG: cell division protein FtsZ [Alphaproteobacteria bacterium]